MTARINIEKALRLLEGQIVRVDDVEAEETTYGTLSIKGSSLHVASKSWPSWSVVEVTFRSLCSHNSVADVVYDSTQDHLDHTSDF